ncbi:MAG TPA: hypothetical protein VGW38_07430 [Chloroflexota bacterium]|nr:hypothetical protein [Chloroflexota bacterium]
MIRIAGRRWCIFLATLAAVLSAAPGESWSSRSATAAHVIPAGHAAAPLPLWAQLGPLEPRKVLALAPSPAWPADPFLLIVRENDIVRTSDGGRTWEQLSALSGAPVQMAASNLDAGRIVFSLLNDRVLRSVDEGTTWEEVLALPAGATGSMIVLSPAFSRDGLIVTLAGGQAYRSVDSGATWEHLPADGQLVQQVVFSPNYASDRRLYLVATTGNFPDLTEDGAEADADDHMRSAGILVSTDGGQTFQATAAGLAIDGIPFRHVQRLFLSPTYGRDGILFAYAWGPRNIQTLAGSGALRTLHSALFKSTDRGSTWKPVRIYPEAITRRSALVAFSPSFVDDKLLLVAESAAALSPASAACEVFRSGDAGETWTSVVRRGSYESCSSLNLVRTEQMTLAAVQKGASWLKSLDGGLTWESFSTPIGIAAMRTGTETAPQSRALVGPVLTASAPVVAIGRQLLVGAPAGGVWVLGERVVPTYGAIPCGGVALGSIAPFWQSDPWVRSYLGCPSAPEERVMVQERRDVVDLPTAVKRGYWIDGADAEAAERWPYWFNLLGSTDAARGDERWRAHFLSTVTKEAHVWPQPGVRREAMSQQFDGGVVLTLTTPEGTRSVLVLAMRHGAWREYPLDAPSA